MWNTIGELIREPAAAEVEVIFANDPRAILHYTKNVLCCDIHTRQRSKRLLKLAAGAEKVLWPGRDYDRPCRRQRLQRHSSACWAPNKATEDSVKLFPRDCQALWSTRWPRTLRKATGKHD